MTTKAVCSDMTTSQGVATGCLRPTVARKERGQILPQSPRREQNLDFISLMPTSDLWTSELSRSKFLLLNNGHYICGHLL
jgi:hypothetical protein